MTLASCDLSTFLQLQPLAQPVHCRHQLDIHLILTWPTKITKSASRKTQPRAECVMPPSEPGLPLQEPAMPEPLALIIKPKPTPRTWRVKELTLSVRRTIWRLPQAHTLLLLLPLLLLPVLTSSEFVEEPSMGVPRR